jgi:hypothetical protein
VDEADLARMLKALKQQCPELYRHIVGFIRGTLNWVQNENK